MHDGKLIIASGCHDDVPYDPGAFRTFYSDAWCSVDGGHGDLMTDSPGLEGCTETPGRCSIVVHS